MKEAGQLDVAACMVFRDETIWRPWVIFSINRMAWGYRGWWQYLIDPHFHPEIKTGVSLRPCHLKFSSGNSSHFWFFSLHLGIAGKKEEVRFICGTRFPFRLLLRCTCEIKDRSVSNCIIWQTQFFRVNLYH